jgi:molybdate transport system regulatory protein
MAKPVRAGRSAGRKSSSTSPAVLYLRVDFGEHGALGPGKTRLMELIAETGSISAAGRAMGMSYRRAWLLVDSLNAAFAEPLVAKQTGGSGGGGSAHPARPRVVLRYRRSAAGGGGGAQDHRAGGRARASAAAWGGPMMASTPSPAYAAVMAAGVLLALGDRGGGAGPAFPCRWSGRRHRQAGRIPVLHGHGLCQRAALPGRVSANTTSCSRPVS